MRPLLVILSLVLGPGGSSAARPSGELPEGAAGRAIDAYTGSLVARGDLSGQLLVLREGSVLVERSFGQADIELGVPVTPETEFNIASVTKPMTAVLAIQLIQEGAVGLGDSIARWFPDFPRGDSIRVEHLLRHRSGIPHETMPDSEMTRPFTAAEVVDRAKRLPLDFSPNARESYSSGGFEVLARILELASGRSYPELLEERLFRRLGMERSGHVDTRMLVPGRASSYIPGLRGLENAPFQDFSGLIGAGSVWSTARDLHRFVAAVVAGNLGPGPRVSFVRAGRLDFNGRTGGFKAWALWDSTTGVEAIFVGNVSTGAPDALKREILRLAQGETVSPPEFPTLRADATPVEALRRWEGVYQIENGPRITMRVKGGALFANEWVLLPTTDGAMFSPRDYGLVRGVAGSGGRLERLDWVQGSGTYPAPRVGD